MWPFSAYPESSPSQVDGKSYDYVIVGGGTAGCVLASRLSGDPDVSVLLLEKGGVKDNMMSRIPLASQNMGNMGDTLQVQSTRWSEPIPGANWRKNRLWTAEGIGGASRINAMLWTRCTPADYASWSELGLSDWGWEQVEPYFRKLENAISHPESKARGHQGPVTLRQGVYPYEWPHYLQKAAQSLGLPIKDDCNEPEAPAMGFFTLDTVVDQRSKRHSAFRAFLGKDVALQRRGRLTICTGAIASRLELDSEAGVVNGVHIQPSQPSGGDATKEFFVRAKREVIICSGAICTPQLLLLSGIGPKDPQSSLDTPPIKKELPAVGATLSDHYSFPIMLEIPKKETLQILESIWALWYMLLWLVFGKGLLSMPSNAKSIFVRTSALDEKTMSVKAHNENGADNMDSSQPRNIPDIEIMLIPTNCFQRPVPGRSLFCLFPTMVQPGGTGRIELASSDPLAHPRVTHPMFLDAQEIVVARRAVRFTMRLAEEFQNSGYPYPAPITFAPGNNLHLLSDWEKSGDAAVVAQPAQTPLAGESKQNAVGTKEEVKVESNENKTWKNVTDEEIDDYLKRVSHSSLHYSCTCPISQDEKTGVVDQQLRVYGFKNLRIADASVFPRIVSGHTMAPVMMVAERCADFVKGAWKGAG